METKGEVFRDNAVAAESDVLWLVPLEEPAKDEVPRNDTGAAEAGLWLVPPKHSKEWTIFEIFNKQGELSQI